MIGIVNLLKPPGMSSGSAVGRTRHILGKPKAGHTGTLDPGAAGVLPICIGRATRIIPYLDEQIKIYIAEVRLGCATDTCDSYGRPVGERVSASISYKQLTECLKRFQGEQMQVAPAYSALKHEGQALYKMARAGKAVPQKRRTVYIDEIELLEQYAPDHFLMRVVCSKGTYIRSLCRDIGDALHTGGYLAFLLRERSGLFDIAQSVTFEQLQSAVEAERLTEVLMPCEAALKHMRPVEVPVQYKAALLNGAQVPAACVANQQALRVYCAGKLVGVGIPEPAGLRLKLRLIEEDE